MPRDDLAELMAEVLSRQANVRRAVVVTGSDGLDEVTLAGPTRVRVVERGVIERETWNPEDFGLARQSVAAIGVSNPQESAALIKRVLEGERGPARDFVLANSAGALYATGKHSVGAGAALAARAIDSGAAKRLLRAGPKSRRPVSRLSPSERRPRIEVGRDHYRVVTRWIGWHDGSQRVRQTVVMFHDDGRTIPEVSRSNSRSGAEPMVPSDPESSPLEPTSFAPERNVTQSGQNEATVTLGGMGRLLVFASAAGLIAGVVSLLAGEVVLSRYRTDLLAPLTISPSPAEMRRWKDARLYSATLTFAAMGACFGLAMGLAGGAVRRSVAASARAAILGFALGTAGAAGAAVLLVSIFFKRHDPQSGDLVLPLLTHGAIWSAVGALGGLAFGVGLGGRGRWKSTLVGGLVGAAAATIVYEIVGALAFATDNTDLPAVNLDRHTSDGTIARRDLCGRRGGRGPASIGQEQGHKLGALARAQ